MDSTMVKDFQTKIVNADRGQLIIISYEMLIAQIEDAIMQIEKEKETEFSRSMVKAHRILRELSSNLDFKYDIAKDLMSIYIYINKKFIDASIKCNKEPLDEAKRILAILLNGWKEADKQDSINKPLIENGQKVYAGLTYGKGTLNEMVYDGNTSRGFRA